MIAGTSVAEVTDRPGAVSPMALAAQTSPATPGFLSSAGKTQISCPVCSGRIALSTLASRSDLLPNYCTGCRAGYYLVSGYCYSCPNSCSTCISFLTCSSCDSDYEIKDGRCSSNSNQLVQDSSLRGVLTVVVSALFVMFSGIICMVCCCNKSSNNSNPRYQSRSLESQNTIRPKLPSSFSTKPDSGNESSAPSPIVVQGRPTFSPGMSSMPSNFEDLRAPLVVGQPSNRYKTYKPPVFEFINMETRPQGYDYPRGSN